MEEKKLNECQNETKIYLGSTPKEIENAPIRFKKKLKKEMFYICTIIKDEHDYIREWALYNKSIGFDKIVLYDNNSSKPYDEVLGDLMQSGFIEMRVWTENQWSRQSRVYNDFVWSGNWNDTDYCAFIDPDEFIFFDKAQTISQFMELYSEFAGVGLSWRMYNADGRVEAPKGIHTTKAYTKEFNYREPRIKVLARLTDVDKFPSVHAFEPLHDKRLVTTGGRTIFGMHNDYKDFTNGHIKHFITKSWEDWVKRLRRGNITKGLRDIDMFFKCNPDMEHLRYELTKKLDFDEFPTLYRDNKLWDGD